MSRRRPPRLKPQLNLSAVADAGAGALEQSFQVSSEAFSKANFKVGARGLEVLNESAGSAGVHAGGKHGGRDEGKSGASPGRRSSTTVGDLNPDQLTVIKELGRGASSFVQLVVDQKTEKKMALKVMNVFDNRMRSQLMRELKTLYKCNCHALVSFYGCYYREGKISVAIEYMDMGSLDQVLLRHARSGMPENILAAITFQCLWGLAYLKHEHRLHRDIKPQNILLNSHGNVKLTDFGVSRELENTIGKCATIVGTFKYMSPERILAEKYSYASDVWSLGLVLIELATNCYPYSEIRSMIEMAQAVTESDPPTLPADRDFTPEFADFISKCLLKDSHERPAADMLLGHAWLKLHSANTMKSATAVCNSWVQKLVKK